MEKRIKPLFDVNNSLFIKNVENFQRLKNELSERNLGRIENNELVYDSNNEKEIFDLIDKIMLTKFYKK